MTTSEAIHHQRKEGDEAAAAADHNNAEEKGVKKQFKINDGDLKDVSEKDSGTNDAHNHYNGSVIFYPAAQQQQNQTTKRPFDAAQHKRPEKKVNHFTTTLASNSFIRGDNFHKNK